jgi:hypothetical protein
VTSSKLDYGIDSTGQGGQVLVKAARSISPVGRGRIASSDAIRVRASALVKDSNPSPQPSPNGRGSTLSSRLKFNLIFVTDQLAILGR